MSTPYLGEIIIFGGNFAPQGYALCDGQLLAINQFPALFSLLGTTYGGDGRTTFGLPNLQSRVPLHPGQGAGLSPYVLGEQIGSENVTLLTNEVPSHSHSLAGTTSGSTSRDPVSNVLAQPAHNIYDNSTAVAMAGGSIVPSVGGNQPHTNLQPFLAVNFCIALEGIFPPRN